MGEDFVSGVQVKATALISFNEPRAAEEQDRAERERERERERWGGGGGE